ncbi:MAG: PAS domain-containing protein [Acidobacteria bacterium]|nr:PAS domain-containing protein [Acidobacteriota bacterium]
MKKSAAFAAADEPLTDKTATLRPATPLEGWYERLYTMLLASIPFSLIVIDRSLQIVSANRNFLEKSRRRERDTLGARVSEIFPSAILGYTRLEAKIQRVFETGKPLDGEQMTYRAPGIPTRIYYYTVVPIKRDDGMVENALLLMDDITEKVNLIEKTRWIEGHLASVVENANDLVISTDSEGRVITWNPAAEHVSGYRAEEVGGRQLADLCDPGQRQEMTAIIQQLVTGHEVKSLELNLLASSGKSVPVAWSCSPMRDDSGHVSGVVAVGRDLSERRAFEMQLFQSEKLAALGIMAGGIAHELRNPLSVSFSAAQFLLAQPLDETFREECIQKVISGIQRASTIIETLLHFAKPSENARLQPVDLGALVRETVRLVAHQARLQKVKLSLHSSLSPVSILGNANLLQQVVMNLILNACQAMPTGGDLAIAVDHEEADAIVRMQDSGCGISPTNLRKIFDPFFTTRPIGSGTGLGLTMSYTIVEQHRGSLEVESVEGQGSTFTVRLPLAPWG